MLLKTLFAACGVALPMSAAAATTLTVYTALEPDQLKSYKGLYAGIPEISVSPAPVPPRAHPGR